MRFEFCCPLIFHFKSLSSIFIHWHTKFQYSHSFLLSSSDTFNIHSLLLFLARYINIVYLLDPQLLACTLIKPDPLMSPSNAWDSRSVLTMLTVSHSQSAKKCEWRILFMLTQKFLLRVIFENIFEELSDCDSHQNTTHILHAVFRTNPQFYPATKSAESGNCWSANYLIHRIEAGSKTICFVVYQQ